MRLGRGGGFYDRSLALAAPEAPLIAVVRDEEVLDELPCEPHDVRMTHALTPGTGVTSLGAGMTRAT
ncbi:5-formyltetrahydrofolate cyclo-ligase [Mycobacterium talmoniae]|uniref:5-formyltetrahydrofolate cyclo-ligase n=1 Tax=Mycobacterium talmoniae TaxID=1858794 RepID=A0A2S8BQM9_9MYCO|nr:5-formyltetrahydrofolate cyclo-ligase [Mycobacterium talmoniae]